VERDCLASDGIDTASRIWTWTVYPQVPIAYIPAKPGQSIEHYRPLLGKPYLAGRTGNSTDSYNVSVNGTWYNSTNTFKNTTTVPHGWSNITVWAYNSSGPGSLSAGSVIQNTQGPK